MQGILTFVIPYAFTGYYPVALLLGKNLERPLLAFAAPFSALITGSASCIFWKLGLKHYGSAGA
ncbi:MAG: ABC-2 family transporter protein [Treponema sp.]|nr:ABC-2 family transporter protein [Treponema sp.]